MVSGRRGRALQIFHNRNEVFLGWCFLFLERNHSSLLEYWRNRI